MSRAPIYVYCDGRTLRPVDAYAAEQLQKLHEELPKGEFFARLSRLTAKGKDERQGIRGLWWAGVNLLAESVEDPAWDTPRKAHERILEGLGYVRPRWRANGSLELVVVSTTEENMDDEEAQVLQERARPMVLQKWGFDPWQKWVDQKEAEEAARQARGRR